MSSSTTLRESLPTHASHGALTASRAHEVALQANILLPMLPKPCTSCMCLIFAHWLDNKVLLGNAVVCVMNKMLGQ